MQMHKIIKQIVIALKNKKILAVVLAVILLIIIINTKGCGRKNGQTYEFTVASMGSVKKTISVTGTLQIIDGYNVLAKVGGMVEKIYVDFNDKVKRGQVLARIDSKGIDQAIIKTRLHIDNYKMTLEDRKNDLKLKEKNYKEGFVSKKAVEAARKALKSVQNSYTSIMMDYRNQLQQKRNTRLVAPISGIIITRNIIENSPIGGNHHCFTIAPTLKRMRLIITIDESDIGNIKKGQKVSFTVSAFPRKNFYGKIEQVRMHPHRRGGLVVYESVVYCDNKELLLKPGMTATATVNVNKKENVLRVLNQAFMISPVETKSDPKKKFVWIKSEKLIKGLPLERVEVNAGLSGDMYSEILGGIKKGDKVLVKVIEENNR